MYVKSSRRCRGENPRGEKGEGTISKPRYGEKDTQTRAGTRRGRRDREKRGGNEEERLGMITA